jgi:release factor glutamine methyltransferase
MRFACTMVVAFANHVAVVHNHGSNERIGVRKALGLSGQFERTAHEGLVVLVLHLAKVLRYLWAVTWRELQHSFLEARNRFAAEEARAHWRRWVEFHAQRSAGMIALDGNLPAADHVLERWNRDAEELRTSKPIQYILGFEHFDGLRIQVSPAVLIPRPETEELVQLAAERAPRGGSVLDLGTGSGCIPLALSKRRPDLRVRGLDVSSEALNVARRNAAELELNVEWMLGDLNDDAPDGLKADVVLSNPPYVGANEQLEPEVVDFEPALALFAPAEDILFFYRRVLDWADQVGAKQLGLECHSAHAQATAERAQSQGWTTELLRDQFGAPRWVWGTKPEPKPYL